MSRHNREWQIFSNFSVKKRIEEMGDAPSWADIKKYGNNKEQLMLTIDEQQDVQNAIDNLLIFPEQGKDLKLLGLKSIRAAHKKVRVHYTIDEWKKNIHITRIEFRAKLYQPIDEYFDLIGDDLYLLLE